MLKWKIGAFYLYTFNNIVNIINQQRGNYLISTSFNTKQNTQYKYKVTVSRFRATIIAVDKQ
jgi:hypothetical protein